jgi:hypothetical protein
MSFSRTHYNHIAARTFIFPGERRATEEQILWETDEAPENLDLEAASKSDPFTVYYRIKSMYNAGTSSAWVNGINYPSLRAAQTALEAAPRGKMFMMLAHSAGDTFRTHQRSDSLYFLKTIGKKKWGNGPGTDTWVIVDEDNAQVAGRLHGKLTKHEDVRSEMAAAYQARVERQSRYLVEQDHFSSIWGGNFLKTESGYGLSWKFFTAADDLSRATANGHRLNEEQEAAYQNVIDALRTAAEAFKFRK